MALSAGAAVPPGGAVKRPRARARPHEILGAGYFGLTALLAAASGAPLSIWLPTLALHAAIVLVLLFLLPRLPERGWPADLRDWAPVFGLPFVYGEIAHLNDLFTEGYYDRDILRLEAALFASQPSVVLREFLSWKPFSEYLHFGYLAYYAIGPAAAGSLYLEGRREAFRYMLTVAFSVFFVCYVIFILYPVAGPWYVFARPDPERMGWLFPEVEHAILARGATVGAAFPSSHVAAALSVWLLTWRLSRQVFWVLAAIVPALIVGTVYGGFHYGVDALAGIVLGVAGYLAGPWIHHALGGRVPSEVAPRASRASREE